MKPTDSAARRVGENVRRLRTERGWTLADVAERVTSAGYPMSLNTVSKIERTVRTIDADDIEALAIVFELDTIDELFNSISEEVAGVRRLLHAWLQVEARFQELHPEYLELLARRDQGRELILEATKGDSRLTKLVKEAFDAAGKNNFTRAVEILGEL